MSHSSIEEETSRVQDQDEAGVGSLVDVSAPPARTYSSPITVGLSTTPSRTHVDEKDKVGIAADGDSHRVGIYPGPTQFVAMPPNTELGSGQPYPRGASVTVVQETGQRLPPRTRHRFPPSRVRFCHFSPVQDS